MKHLILLTLLIVGCGEYEREEKGVVVETPPSPIVETPTVTVEDPQVPPPLIVEPTPIVQQPVIIDNVTIDVALDIVLDRDHNGLTCLPKKHKKKYTGKYKCTSSSY